MQLEVIRSVADWLAHATNGANAEIANVPRDGGDSAPTSLVAVLDETRSEILALKRIPDEQTPPFLFVWFSGDAALSAVNQAKQDADSFEITIAYVDRDSNAAAAVRDGAYVMRAVRRSMNRLHENANLASRMRNSIEVRNGNIRMRLVRPSVELESAVVSLGLAITYAVRDTLP
jgi:hypothetical protein